MKKRNVMLLGVPLAVGSTLLAGCSQPQTSNDSAPTAKTDGANTAAGTDRDDVSAKQTRTTRLEFTSAPATLKAGQPVKWTLKIIDEKSGQPLKDFARVHDKLMHLIVVSKDLSWFNHIHPEYSGNGIFNITTNLPRAGAFKLYADYTPEGRTQEVAQHEVTVGGDNALPATASLTPDKIERGWMVKQVNAHPEEKPASSTGTPYQVALMPMPTKLVAGKEVMLHFQVRDAKGTPLKDLQPYLGAMGHCVVISADSTSFLHSHPMEEGMEHGDGHTNGKAAKGTADDHSKHAAPPKSGGPDVMFHTTFPSAGLYKTWGQFKHKGQVVTASFVVNVEAGEAGADTEATPHDH